MKKNISIIGTGNLGRSIAEGIVAKNLTGPNQITLTKRDISTISDLENRGYNLTQSNLIAAQSADVILLCVQPNQVAEVLEEIKELLDDSKLLISVVTGVSIKELTSLMENKIPVVRAMPNTAISIGESMTCISSADKEGLEIAKSLFDALGKTLIIDEKLMQAATVLGASGIAFFMRYLRAATQGGIQMGFDAADAQMIAMQTAKGAASLVLENESHPEVEIDKVTTPQGCTIEGLNEMEHKGFSSALIQGIMTSFFRITKMKSKE
ncbi:pyrroline-5-carboxylate reductase [Ekhidna sp.]